MAAQAGIDDAERVGSILKTFEKYGILKRGFEGESDDGFRGRGITLLLGKFRRNEVPIDWNTQALLEAEAKGKLEQMKKLLFTPRCRKRFVLEYFGDEEDLAGLPENCGSCDYCLESGKPNAKAGVSVPLSAFEIALDAVEAFDGKF